MPNVSPTYDYEIDLIEWIVTIWDGKWKIISIIVFSLLSVFGLNIVNPQTTFSAKTDIKSITSDEFDKYSLFNESLKKIQIEGEQKKEFNIFEITPEFLLSLYLEKLEEGALLETGIDKYDLINKDDFDSESDYKEAIEKFASKIEVFMPINIDGKAKGEKRLHYALSAVYNDQNKWKDLLTFVNKELNRKVKTSIINRFATVVSVQNQLKNFAIKDIEKKIDNVKEEYYIRTQNKLAFLAEQASIARKLDIKKNTISSQKFNEQNRFIINGKNVAPFYLRGYIAIEEEIKQINNRKDKDSFIQELFELKKQKRKLEQDETLLRATEIFNKTPLNQNDFRAAIVKVATTDFELSIKTNLYYPLAIILGGMIGAVYVLIANAFRNRKTNTVSL